MEEIIELDREIANCEFWVSVMGAIWIITWYACIWIFSLQFFLTGLFSLALGLMTIEIRDDYRNELKTKLKEWNQKTKHR